MKNLYHLPLLSSTCMGFTTKAASYNLSQQEIFSFPTNFKTDPVVSMYSIRKYPL